MVPLVLREMREKFGLRVALIVAGVFSGSIALIGLLFRPIDPKALFLLDLLEAKQKQSQNNEKTAKPTESPVAEIGIAPEISAQIQQPKGKLQKARALFMEYFRHFPVLICDREFVLFTVCFCGIICGIFILLLTIDSFVGTELRGEHTGATITMIGLAIGDLVGRLLSGALTVIPVLIPKVAGSAHQISNTQNEEATTIKNAATSSKQSLLLSLYRGTLRFLNVRVIYVLSCWLAFLSMSFVVCLALFSPRPPSYVILFIVYMLLGVGWGGSMSVSKVVIVELVGLRRLAAAHSIILLLSTPPIAAVPFIAGVLKDVTRSWTLPYIVFGTLAFVSALVNSFFLLGCFRPCAKHTRTRS